MAVLKKIRADFPAYSEGLSLYLAGEYLLLQKKIKKRQFSAIESDLLGARILLKKKKFKEAQEKLSSLASCEEIFFEAEKDFLWAQLLSELALWQKAYAKNQRALALYQTIGDQRGQFLCQYNASVDMERLMLLEVAHFHLLEAQNFAHSPSEKMLILRAQAALASKERRAEDALKSIDQAILMSKTFLASPIDLLNLNILAQDIYLQFGQEQKARELLAQLIKDKNTPDPARVFFNWHLLTKKQEKRGLGKAPITIGRHPEYSAKWQILRHLQTGQWQEAENFWGQLQRLFPLRYGEKFGQLSGHDSHGLFASYLKRYLDSGPGPVLQTESQIPKGKLRQLHQELLSARAPLRKEELIERLWKVAYDPLFDARFYKLMERYKKVSGRRVINQHFTYRLL